MPKINLSAEEKKLLKKGYIGSLSCMRTTSSITGQARGMVLAVDPFIERYYATQDEKNEAILRHASEYMNTHQAMFGLIAGIVCAMEKERGEKGNLDTGVITGIKASLMGPLAGIGDSFFFNCYRVIIAGIAIGLSANGSLLGPIFFLVFYGFGLLAMKYLMFVEGYKNGITLVDKASEQGIIPMIMEACGALGAIMVGALISTNVKITLALAPVINGATVSVQEIFDMVMPGILSLILWWFCLKVLKKGFSPIKLIFSIMGACLLLAFLGIL
ncbi:MAG: PTS system mannose/fructose/sorbose family transporter subunit IID [Holdemania filiformis]